MLEYFYPLFFVVATVGMIELLCPDGNISRSVKLVCSFIIIAVLLLPLLRSFGDFDFTLSLKGKAAEYETKNGTDAVIDAAEKELCSRLQKEIADHFGIDGSFVKVMMELDRTDPSSVRIIEISVNCGEYSKETAEYIEEVTGIKASVFDT